MPHAITVAPSSAGIATYKLSGLDELTVLGISFVYDQGGSVSVNGIFVDYRTGSGQSIYLQLVDFTDETTRYSLASGSEPTAVVDPKTGGLAWPQSGGSFGGFATERLSAFTLTPNCTVNIYGSSAPNMAPMPDPMTQIETLTAITDIVMWVEETGGRRSLPPNPPPLLTHEL